MGKKCVCVCVCVFLLFRATPGHMEVHRLGAELELQLLSTATATATRDQTEPRLRPTPQLIAMLDP